MGGVVGAVVGAGASLIGGRRQERAQKRAADQQRQAAIQSARILADAGAEGQEDIRKGAARALQDIVNSSISAQKEIEPFANIEAVSRAQDQIIGNLPISGPFADSIRQASTNFIQSSPEFANLSAPVKSSLAREANFAVGAAQPGFEQALLSDAQQGLAGAIDLSRVRQRERQRLADLTGATATGRASQLVGQTANLANLASGAREAGVLADVAGQQAQTQRVEVLSGLAGQLQKEGVFNRKRSPFGASGFEGTGGI